MTARYISEYIYGFSPFDDPEYEQEQQELEEELYIDSFYPVQLQEEGEEL